MYPQAYTGQRRLFRLPDHNKLTIYRSRPSSLATPPLTGSKPPTALQPSSTTQPRTTFPTTVHRQSRRCFRLHRLSHIHLGSTPWRSIPQWVIVFLRYVFFFSNRRLILFPLPVNTEQFPSNPTVPNPHPSLKTRLRHQYRHPPYCLNSPVGLPPEPRHPLPVPEGTSVTPLSPPSLPYHFYRFTI